MPIARCRTRFVLVPLVLLGCSDLAAHAQARGAEITVYAAASLRDALQEIAPACEAAAGGERLGFIVPVHP